MFINKLHEKADGLLKKGQIEEALKIYLDLLKTHQSSPDLVSDIGVAYLHKNNRELCMQYMNLAIELQPDYGFRYACRAFAHNHFKDLDAAIADYNKAIELDPDDAVAHNNLGLLLEQKGYQYEANKRFEQADRLSKAEKRLFSVMDELEANNTSENKETEISVPSETENEDKADIKSELKKFWSSREQRREFIRFIKNGFRLK